MKTIEQKAMELCAKGGKLDYGRDNYDRGTWSGFNAIAYNAAKEMANHVIILAKRAICTTCFTLKNNGQCPGINSLPDKLDHCEFMQLFSEEMKGE